MKRIILLALVTSILTSCGSKKSMDVDYTGHWLSEEFYNHVITHKNLQNFSGTKIEFVIPENDTNYTIIDFNGKINSGPLELTENNQLVIKNYFGNYKNADVLLEDDKLVLVNNETNDKITFKKINKSEFNNNEIESYGTYALPFINKYTISGKYLLNSDTVELLVSGKIKNLNQTVNYSFCLNESCRMSKELNTIFLSNKNNEGFFYEYLQKDDSLIIYSIDENLSLRGNNVQSNGVKYRMKKIN